MNQEELNSEVLQQELLKELQIKPENDIEIRRSELFIKRVNALTNFEKEKRERYKLQLEERRLVLQERRFELDAIQTKYNIASDMVRKSDKIQRLISKTMLGLFPEQDKQVVKIMEAAKKLTDLQS